MFAGLICAQLKKNRHCKLEFTNADSAIGNAFEIAGGIQLDRDLLNEISSHTSVVYLIFDSLLPELTDELIDFTSLFSRIGGIAIKIDPNTAADLMNQFNYWRVVEKPTLAAGHTFSLTPDSQHYRLTHVDDTRHSPDDPFHNPTGIWRLDYLHQP
jgi:hypothetical protein